MVNQIPDSGSFSGRLIQLRAMMKKEGIDTCFFPVTDPHLGENVPDHWRIIEWLTGFTGSAATVVVTDSFAGLWTDSRYFIQAGEQLSGSGFTFMEPGHDRQEELSAWLEINTPDGSCFWVDGRIISESRMRNIERTLTAKNIVFNTGTDLISDLWSGRPALPESPVFDFPVEYAGRTRGSKIAAVRSLMSEMQADYHLLTSPDDIMWMLNIRGSDMRYSPLALAFALVSADQVLLFIDEQKVPFRLAIDFDNAGIVILPYEETAAILETLQGGSTLLLSLSQISRALYASIGPEIKIVEGSSLPGKLKAQKNSVEALNIGKAMVKDGIALTKFFFLVGNIVPENRMTELSLAEKLNGFRAEAEGYLGPSFAAIVALNAHGALPHYVPMPGTDAEIGSEGLLLVDSGGQYMEGTTDITRTIAIGRPSAAQKKDFTLVLKGHISLASARIPEGTKGVQLDILARRPLWDQGLNYGHGTGHGVGFCLNVHEAPPAVTPVVNNDSRTPVSPGMLFSDEPAIYRDGEYGIRTENLLLCTEDEETQYGKFLRFDTVSLCYIDCSLIDISMMTRNEIKWLNEYHSMVYEKIAPHLSDEHRRWLKEKTEELHP